MTVVDASAPSLPSFPDSVCADTAPVMFEAGPMLRFCRPGASFWTKADHFGWSWGCLDAGRRPWRREALRSWAEWCLGCGRAAMATRVGGRWWLTVLGCVGGVGVSGFITCPILYWPAAATSVDTVSFMKAPSRCPYSFELLRVKTRSLGSDGGGYQWSFPSRRHHLGVLVPSFPSHLPSEEVSGGSKQFVLAHL